MSFSSVIMQSYNVDPLDAAVEVLWFNRIVVVVASGNLGHNALYPPANDPFVITVGAVDEHGTAGTADDTMATFSGYGTSSDGFNKPDLSAPGVNIASLASGPTEILALAHLDHLVANPATEGQYAWIPYFRMSGTSMAAPIVAGAAALLIQNEPNLTPDQVKYRLIDKAHAIGRQGSGTRELDVNAALTGTGTQNSNTNIPITRLLTTGSNPVNWQNVNWTNVNWTNVNWTNVNWTNVNWTNVNWTSDWWNQ